MEVLLEVDSAAYLSNDAHKLELALVDGWSMDPGKLFEVI